MPDAKNTIRRTYAPITNISDSEWVTYAQSCEILSPQSNTRMRITKFGLITPSANNTTDANINVTANNSFAKIEVGQEN